MPLSGIAATVNTPAFHTFLNRCTTVAANPNHLVRWEQYKEGYPLRKDFPLRGRFSRS